MFAPTTASTNEGAAVRPAPSDGWLDLEQAAERLGGVSTRTVQRYTAPIEGSPDAPVLLCARPSRGVWRFRESWVDRFLEETAAHRLAEARAALPAAARPRQAAIDPMVARISDAPSRRRRARPNARRSDPGFLPIPRARPR